MADLTKFVETLRALQSSNNVERNAAEQVYSDAKAQQPIVVMSSLFQALALPQADSVIKEHAAVLLRQCLRVQDDSSPWAALPLQTQVEFKGQLLQLLEAERHTQVRRKVADIIKFLGNQLICIEDADRPNNASEWPELLPFVMRMVMDTSKDGEVRADALFIVKELQRSIWQIMVANSQQTAQVLRACLSDPHEAVQAKAVSTMFVLLDHVDKKQDRAALLPLAGDFCASVARLAQIPDSSLLQEVLQVMEATENSSAFFKDSLTSGILPLLAPVAQGHKEQDARKLALEVLLSFIEARPKTGAKAVEYLDQVFNIAIQFIVEKLMEAQEWGQQEATQQDDDGVDDEEEFVKVGGEVIDRLAASMNKVEKFSMVLEMLKPKIAMLFQDGDWRKTSAGLILLSSIAEYIDDEPTILQLLSAIRAQLKATNVRVRFEAWGALAQFSSDHDEVVTDEKLAPEILPEFLQGLNDPCSRVVCRSMDAFQLYGQEVERELLEPFVQPMMAKLGQQLQAASLPIQRRTVTYIAVLAGQMEDGFAQYYQLLMPVLKQIVQTMLHRVEERTLLGKAFECMSLLAKAVGTAGFKADAEEIMRAMVQAATMPNLPSNDPVKEYMMHAAQRICWTMKEDFLPFVPGILPGILEKFSITPKELNAETKGNIKDEDEVEISLVAGEDGKPKLMILYTSEREEIKNAVECVHTFVEELGKLYAPFVAQTAQALLPVFDFSIEEIRDLAFETWGELCRAAREGGEVAMLGQLVQEFMQRVLATLEKEEKSEDPDTDNLKTGIDGLTVCIKKAGPGVLSAQQLQHVTQVACRHLEASFRRREASKKELAKQEKDEEEDEEDFAQSELPLRIGCVELLGALMQQNPQVFAAQELPAVLQLVQTLIQVNMPPPDRRLAIFICCDFLLHLEGQAVAHWPVFMSHVLQDVLHPVVDLRMAACYAVSLAAKSPAFADVVPDALAKLTEVISQSRGRAKRKSEKPAQACADNALTALSEILQHHKATVAAQEAPLWHLWLQSLPCQEDDEEGVKNHSLLLKLVQAEKPEIVGEGGSNLPQVLSVFVDVYKSDMVDEATTAGIAKLVLQLGQARLEQFSGKLSEKQRKKLVRICREAQSG